MRNMWQTPHLMWFSMDSSLSLALQDFQYDLTAIRLQHICCVGPDSFKIRPFPNAQPKALNNK